MPVVRRLRPRLTLLRVLFRRRHLTQPVPTSRGRVNTSGNTVPHRRLVVKLGQFLRYVHVTTLTFYVGTLSSMNLIRYGHSTKSLDHGDEPGCNMYLGRSTIPYYQWYGDFHLVVFEPLPASVILSKLTFCLSCLVGNLPRPRQYSDKGCALKFGVTSSVKPLAVTYAIWATVVR